MILLGIETAKKQLVEFSGQNYYSIKTRLQKKLNEKLRTPQVFLNFLASENI
jgi:hypothetical protein